MHPSTKVASIDSAASGGRPGGAAIKALPYPVYFYTVLILGLGGLVASAYLSMSHYRVYTDVSYESFCAISRAVNCDTVSQHPTSVFVGMPVPVWGVWAYGFFCLVLGFARPGTFDRRRLWTLLMLTALGFSIYSCILAFISTFYIHSYCIVCILSYAINFLLLFYTWMVRKRFGAEPLSAALRQDIRYLQQQKRRALGVFVPYATAFVLAWTFFPVYWNFSPPVLVQRIPTGVNENGHPWIGAEDPELVITEFTDYLCFQCNKMHFYLRKLIGRYPQKIRLVHRHFPMDHTVNPIVQTPVHQGAGILTLVALVAEKQGKFWPVSDYIFNTARADGELDLEAVGKIIGMARDDVVAGIEASDVRHRLKRDLIDGLKLGVSGTPTFVIDGRIYPGYIPADIIARVLEQ